MDAAWDAALHACSAAPEAAWDVVTRAYDASAPWSPDARLATDTQEALHACSDVATWFLDTSADAYYALCCDAFAPLADGASDSLPEAAHTCFEWVASRHALWSELCTRDEDSKAFLGQCRTLLAAALRPGMMEAIRTYLAGVLSGPSPALLGPWDASAVQVVAQLRALGLDALVQSALMQAATEVLHEAAARAIGSSGHSMATYPALQALLRDELLPALTAVLEARPAHPALGTGNAVAEVWDVSLSHAPDESAVPSEHASLYLRLEYSLAQAIGAARLQQLYELVREYPRSQAAMEDLVVWLDQTGERAKLVQALAQALHARLLHPGVDTHTILVYYVNIVYALRLVDSTGVVLSQVLPPVQSYLRTRSDTIQAVVHALLGDDPAFQLLRIELEQGTLSDTNEDLAPDADAADEQYSRPDYWDDPAWEPRPVDAGPAYSQMRSRDVIGLLVSIFDDRAGFLQALERHTAQQLVHTIDYDTRRVQRNNAIFKQRLGTSSLHHCDVMLADVAASQALDERFHRDAADLGPDAQAVHPLVLSRQFWPDIDTRTYTLPRRLAEALDAYAAFFARGHPTKRVRWLPHVGTVDVSIEMDDGRRIEARVAPLQAAVVELVAGLGEAEVTAENVEAALGLERESATAALRFWSERGVLRELPAPAVGVFERIDATPHAAAHA
ncbi:hypothetical protein MNAN1_000813 [Malassezia nana]|uniref:Cullin family profile domain-containing protein n=1 Tax=Malassezia nana TaxID=180528 RepID=A0AAF0EN97_9BASI|nr:hypothetical protein MNAN1_000813 [Malassezia nana]